MGYNPLPPQGPLKTAILKVEITRVRASAYDLIFFRRILCEVGLRATLVSSAGVLLHASESEGRSSSLKAFAFTPQIEWELTKAVNAASENLLSQLRL